MIKITELRCYKNFRPMQIVNVPQKGKAGNLYNVLGQDGKPVGRFSFYENGEVGDLFIDKRIRRKQASVNALLSIMDFVIDLAKQKKLDIIRFYAKKYGSHNTERLYGKIAPFEENHLLTKWFSLPVTKEGERIIEERHQFPDFLINPFDLFSL